MQRVVGAAVAAAAVLVAGAVGVVAPVAGAAAAGTRAVVQGPAGFVAASASFSDAEHGWLLGSAPCLGSAAGPACTTVVRTSDGGATWIRTGAPAASLLVGVDGPGSVDQVRFADVRDGYAAGDGLWTTHDAGTTWRRLSTVAGVPDAVVTDVATTPTGVYALVSGREGGGSDGHVRLAHSPAGSDAFTVVRDLGTTVNALALVSGGSAAYVAYTLAGQTTYLLRADGPSVTSHVLPGALATAACWHLSASSATAVLLECGEGGLGGGMGTRSLYRSDDAGASFTPLPDPGEGAGYDTTGIADAGGAHAVLATTSATGTSLLTSSDDARTWRTSLSFTGTDQGDVLSGLSFTDPTHGVVINSPGAASFEQSPWGGPAAPGTGVAYRTSDGGQSWQPITFPPAPAQPLTWASDPANAFTQHAATVAVTTAGHPLAEVTETSLTPLGAGPSAGARLTLSVHASAPFALANSSLALHDTDGESFVPDDPATTQQLTAGSTQTITVTWTGVHPSTVGAQPGAVEWAPGAHHAAVWALPGLGQQLTWASDPADTYAQHASDVDVVKSGHLLAWVVEEAWQPVGSGGRLTLRVDAAAPFAFSNTSLHLQDTRGATFAPDVPTAAHTNARGVTTLTITWAHVSPGASPRAIAWTPGAHHAGSWSAA